MESLRTDSLSELVFHRIQEKILNREFRPGTFLPSEKELAEQFRVGKSSVREAIKMLQILGVVESRQGVGTYIRETMNSNVLAPMLMELTLQQSTTQDLVEFREMFEFSYTQVALQKCTEADIHMLQESYAEFCKKHEDGVLTGQDDIDFHLLILNMTRNPFTIKIGETVLEFLRSAVEDSVIRNPDWTVRNHGNIVNAFHTRSEEQMRFAMKGVFDNFKDCIEKRDAQEKSERSILRE